jgi:hypothetical protein
MEDIPNGFYPIAAYTNGYEIVVIGLPEHLPEEHPLAHNCDVMGCGSLDHVVTRIPVLQPTPELEWGRVKKHNALLGTKYKTPEESKQYCELCGKETLLLVNTENGGKVWKCCEVCWSEYDGDFREMK